MIYFEFATLTNSMLNIFFYAKLRKIGHGFVVVMEGEGANVGNLLLV